MTVRGLNRSHARGAARYDTAPLYPGAALALDYTRGRYKGSSGQVVSDLLTPGLGFTFSRTGAGTAEDASGVYSSFATNTPRRTSKGLLGEEARTNLTLSSQAYSGANWTKSGCAAGALVAGPDGAVSATPITEASSNARLHDAAGLTVVAGSTYAVSKIIKRGNCDFVRVVAGDAGNVSNGVRAWINLAAGALASYSTIGTGWSHATAPQVHALGDGFYRITLFAVPPGTTLFTATQTAGAGGSNNPADVGSGVGIGSSYVIHNTDVTLGAFPTSPILTTGAAATRGADTPTLTLTAPTTAVTFFVEAVVPRGVSTDARITLSDGGTSNRVYFSLNSSGLFGASIKAGVASAGGLPTTLTPGSVVKMAISCGPAGTLVAVNGVIVDSGPGTLPPGLTRIDYGNASYAAGRYWNDFIRKTAVWRGEKTAAELQDLTRA